MVLKHSTIEADDNRRSLHMDIKLPILSPQMATILRLLNSQGPMKVHEVSHHLWQSGVSQNRRAFSASMSRTILRMERRGLIVREDASIMITEVGIFRIAPAQFERMLEKQRQDVQEALSLMTKGPAAQTDEAAIGPTT
jgi:predicted transcriptional regulator